MKALFPYRTLFGDVTVGVPEIRIDDEVLADKVDVDQRTINLHNIDRAKWETATVSLIVTGPPGEIESAIDPTCIAVANCGPTNTRTSEVLVADPDTPGRWAGELTFERNFSFAQAEIRCGVVATVEGESHRVVGWADTWRLMFDDLPNRPVNGAIKITWIDFADPGENLQYLRRHSDNYMYLSIDPDEPQLFLNRGFDGLEPLLADRGKRTHDRALHDHLRGSIADKTWTALFNSAIEGVVADDTTEEPSWPVVDWQRAVLEALLARIYPEVSPEERLSAAWSARRAPDNPGALQQLLVPAASVQARVPPLLRAGIRVVARELENAVEETTS